LSTLLQGAWAVQLGRYSGQEQVVFGVTTSGRMSQLAGIEEMVGLLITTLPVHAEGRGEELVGELLGRMQERVGESQRHGHAPVVEIEAQSGVTPGEPLFQSLLVFENYQVGSEAEAGGWTFGVEDGGPIQHTNYPLVVVGIPGERLQVRFSYDGRQFDE